jgi:hypothetical protein
VRLKRLSQPTTKSTRTALHHPHHGGDKSGATLAWHTLGALEMALLNSKFSSAFAEVIEQLSCRFARTSGRWVAGPFLNVNKAARHRSNEPIQANCPVSLSKVMAEAVRTAR